MAHLKHKAQLELCEGRLRAYKAPSPALEAKCTSAFLVLTATSFCAHINCETLESSSVPGD